MATRRINRVKTILVDKGKTSKWLEEQLDEDSATVSNWYINIGLPSLEIIMQIADVFKADVRSFIRFNIKKDNYD